MSLLNLIEAANIPQSYSSKHYEPKSKPKDITGIVYGDLTVTRGKYSNQKNDVVHVHCKCGESFDINVGYLINGRKTRCSLCSKDFDFKVRSERSKKIADANPECRPKIASRRSLAIMYRYLGVQKTKHRGK